MTVVRFFNFIVLLSTALFSSTPQIAISGTVTDGTDPVKGAVVSLVSDSLLTDTTVSDGTFLLTNKTGIFHSSKQYRVEHISVCLTKNRVRISLPVDAAAARMNLSTGTGRCIMHISLEKTASGTPRQVVLPELSTGLYLLTVSTGRIAITRKLIVTGAAMYLDGRSAGASSVFADGTGTLSRRLETVDQLKVSREGFITKMVAVEAYEVADLSIELEAEGVAAADPTKTGPYETVQEQYDVTPVGCTLVRPKEMKDGAHQVIAWGNGAGGTTPPYLKIITHLASHGFIVIAPNGTVQHGNPPYMVQAVKWVIEQNGKSSSPFYGKVDTKFVGAIGHSQGGYAATEAATYEPVTTSISISGATGSSNQRGPALIICGGQDPYTDSKCSGHPEGAYNGINNVPVMHANCKSATHTDWFGGSAIHPIESAGTAWFYCHLSGDDEMCTWFYGADCKLCSDPAWVVKSRNMEEKQ